MLGRLRGTTRQRRCTDRGTEKQISSGECRRGRRGRRSNVSCPSFTPTRIGQQGVIDGKLASESFFVGNPQRRKALGNGPESQAFWRHMQGHAKRSTLMFSR